MKQLTGLLDYLKITPGKEIFFQKGTNKGLEVYSNAY